MRLYAIRGFNLLTLYLFLRAFRLPVAFAVMVCGVIALQLPPFHKRKPAQKVVSLADHVMALKRQEALDRCGVNLTSEQYRKILELASMWGRGERKG